MEVIKLAQKAVAKIQDKIKGMMKLKSTAEILKKIAELENDDCLKLPVISPTKNPTLALRQENLRSCIKALKWALSEEVDL